MLKKVILSGASGFIGQALLSALIKSGVEVYGLCAHPDKLGEPDAVADSHIIKAEFSDYKMLPQIITDNGFDVFIHLAWQGYGAAKNDPAVQFSNVPFACDAVQAAISCKCKRFVFISSIHEFQKSRDANGIAGLCSVYGTAKQAARNACQITAHNGGIEFIGIWLDHVFGPGVASPRASNKLIKTMLTEGRVPLTEGKNLCNWIYISDCVSGIMSASERGKPGVTYYLGGGRIRPFADLIQEVRDIVAPKAVLEFGKYPEYSFIDYCEIDTDALHRHTGYGPVCEFRASVIKTAEWIQREMLDP
ncbi:NAD(P)-dependent oxidoreductase [bacterium D16-76]|nr:NAD(P)-dependent oxidoreductase [bacterium D16-76]